MERDTRSLRSTHWRKTPNWRPPTGSVIAMVTVTASVMMTMRRFSLILPLNSKLADNMLNDQAGLLHESGCISAGTCDSGTAGTGITNIAKAVGTATDTEKVNKKRLLPITEQKP